jgi:hypothetical protein
MAQFVEATEDGTNHKVLVNLDLITQMIRQPNDTTLILFADGAGQLAKVKETPEELLDTKSVDHSNKADHPYRARKSNDRAAERLGGHS